MSSKDSKAVKDEIILADGVVDLSNVSLGDRLLFTLAQLMEGGQEDEDTCRTLDSLTTILSTPAAPDAGTEGSKPLYELIDSDAFDSIMGCLDMRQSSSIRGHATLTVSAYLKASDQNGVDFLTEFFKSRISKKTYDDFIVAFSVAAAIFPVVPSLSADLFLSEGFVGSLGTLMRRKWKSKKVEQACLEMLNAACMVTSCREAIQKYCTEWLEEIVVDGPLNAEGAEEDGPLKQRLHSENVRNLAAVILTKLQVCLSRIHISRNCYQTI